ncbi:MAG: ABC transporter permease subunit [Candidatus Auribacterota bacterium]
MQKQFTGRTRKKKTSLSVKAADVISKHVITIGGIGTIIAVSTVCVFLLWVVFPLLKQADISGTQTIPQVQELQGKPLHIVLDEYQLLALNIYKNGSVLCYRLDNGSIIDTKTLFPDKSISASSYSFEDNSLFLGFSDGSISIGELGFKTTFIDIHDLPESVQSIKEGDAVPYESGMIQRISKDQYRMRTMKTDFDDPFTTESSSPVLLLHHVNSSRGLFYTALYEDNTLRINNISKRKNILTGKVSYKRSGANIGYTQRDNQPAPKFLLLSGLGDSLQLVWTDGLLLRYDTRDFKNIVVAEEKNLVPDGSSKITACRYLLGGTSLLAGDSSGTVQTLFPIIDEEKSIDKTVTNLVAAHRFKSENKEVSAISTSQRSRIIGVGHNDGTVELFHVTSEKKLGSIKPSSDSGEVYDVVFAPKDDALLVMTANGLSLWKFDPRYPEITLSSLFTPVWYEGSPEPMHVWQSSSSTDDFEPKYGLMPLVFGTLKATIFSLIFGVPIALLAAIFTSEFLNPKLKSHIKPMVELMASLPSVVLGFLAALVFAPVVADNLALFLTIFITIPISFLLGAYLWQLMPYRFGLRVQKYKFSVMFLSVPAGFMFAYLLAPVIERICFADNIILWLDGQVGNGSGGWFFLLIPLAAVCCAWIFTVILNPALRRVSAGYTHQQCAVLDIAKFLTAILVTLLGSYLGAHILTAIGFDPRGHIFDTYEQRNALVVGFIMGFAIIPIIYTIAEDALNAVPDHLRSASLAAGATKWQTAVRIIIPTAMSGLFSAIMIGLGRAVGETMIVLMAAGNTPVMEWNIFNGFRTLSANIAVELPEAVRNSTHYRTLFLAALTLFIITFILNTIAELVRIRFRKKAVEL